MQQQFHIDTTIYPQSQLLQTLEVFQEYGEVNYDNDILTIQGDSHEEIQEFFGEFMNYALSLSSNVSLS